MAQYLLRRVLLLVPTVLGICVAVFLLIRTLPGDAAEQMLLTQEYKDINSVEQIRAALGIDRPVWEQFGEWFGDLAAGDLGTSMRTGRDISDELVVRLPVSLELALLSTLLSVLIALPIGVLSALKQDTLPDYVARTISTLMLAVPGFWLASLVILLGSIWFDYVPPLRYIKFVDDPWGNLRQFFAPALLLALASSAATMRMTRTMMLEVLRQDYVRTARAKGLKERVVVVRHAIRNGCLPVITIVGLQFGVTLGGTVIFEQIFQLPGLGQYMLEALRTRDYPVIQGLTIILAAFVVLMNFFVDLSYAWLDPRVSYR